eukprot:gnl/TRDRNA2_/TRDRNA2_196016_c0_seq1.p1 gnl/TRDRNA2_/TRDRNA2_196016_c0~~gnl/TRDRNA2_/TRDRNA2_196016_c0_seq1.p1  ORF type:complete len:195 (+),score=26.62 gnl/TRDRNA2_/TRDRNA2_196016_c0_seq1:53-637(+)
MSAGLLEDERPLPWVLRDSKMCGCATAECKLGSYTTLCLVSGLALGAVVEEIVTFFINLAMIIGVLAIVYAFYYCRQKQEVHKTRGLKVTTTGGKQTVESTEAPPKSCLGKIMHHLVEDLKDEHLCTPKRKVQIYGTLVFGIGVGVGAIVEVVIHIIYIGLSLLSVLTAIYYAVFYCAARDHHETDSAPKALLG